MDLISLLNTTGNSDLDAIVLGGIGIVESAFAGRIQGYYLVGSSYSGDAIPDSDVDVIVVPEGWLDAQDIERFNELKISCSLISPIQLDFRLCSGDEGDNQTHLLKNHSLVLFGTDTRNSIPDVLPPHVTSLMQDFVGPLKMIHTFETWPRNLTYPLTYPDPDGEFYGYGLNGIKLNDYPLDDFKLGTRTLIHHLLLGAELLSGLRVARHIISRQQTISNYEEVVSDGWTSILREATERCRDTWFYKIPPDKEDRTYLRLLCKKTLDFENRIVSNCQNQLQKLLLGDCEIDLLAAIRSSGESLLVNMEVHSLLTSLVDDERIGVRQIAGESLARLDDPVDPDKELSSSDP